MTWTLVIIVVMMAGGTNGGVHTSITQMPVSGPAHCAQAKDAVEEKNQIWKGMVTGGQYRVLAKCVNRG